MEKMSELISELRENCQKLQTQLLEVRQVSREQKSVGVQVTFRDLHGQIGGVMANAFVQLSHVQWIE